MALINREQALSHPFANGQYDKEHADEHFIMGFEDYKEWLEDLPTVEAIPKDQYEQRLKENNELINDLEELRTMINKLAESYENRLKADLEAILKEISTTIEEEREDCEKLSNSYERFGIRAMAQRSQIAIQQKIDNLQVNNSKVN